MKIKKKTLLWVIVGVLFVVVIYMTFKPTNAKTDIGKIDMSDWTANEKMNYEMHGIIPARTQGSAPSTSAGTGMVGGC